MVANYRCTEIKDEALVTVKESIDIFQQACNRGSLIHDFKEQSFRIISSALNHYTEQAKQYDQTVFKKIQKELVEQVLSVLYPQFDGQLKILSQEIYTKMKNDVKILEKKDQTEIIDKLSHILKQLFEINIAQFGKKAEALVPENSGWSSSVEKCKKELKYNLKTIVDVCI